MDLITLKRISTLHPKLRSEVADILLEIQLLGIDIRITQTSRTNKEQDILYSQGRTTSGSIVTDAKGGESYHCYSLALDFCLLHKDGSISWKIDEDSNKDNIKDWDQVVKVFKKHGWESGVDWKKKDRPHFQKSFGYTIEQLKTFKKDKEGYIII